MAISTPSNSPSSGHSGNTDTMALIAGGKKILLRIKKKFTHTRDRKSSKPLHIDTKVANTTVVTRKPNLNRTESERRDNLRETPVSPAERRLQRFNPASSLAQIPSQSDGDLNRNPGNDRMRRSFVDQPRQSRTLILQEQAPEEEQLPQQQQQPQQQPQQPPQPPQPQQLQLQNGNVQSGNPASTFHSDADSRSNFGKSGPGDLDETASADAPNWKWILNLSMHFPEHYHREKFFVTYEQLPNVRRRVTISCDYRHAENGSLESALAQLRSQKEKSMRIYDAIQDALQHIKFYETTTNLKLETSNGQLNVHVTEDMHEIIHYPPVNTVVHIDCLKLKESDLIFDSHLSGYVYLVKYRGKDYIKKEIPSPDTVGEFLYEINALSALQSSKHVIGFGGCVLDERLEKVKGLLISYASKGALVDILYNERRMLSWDRKESWARQIVAGLADIHEAGYVQGDFTLSNIVIDENDDAKIIDINRRGCPVHWEPPEISRMIDGLQKIGIYIGVKSDIFQLGMCLWGIAMENDEPEYVERPLYTKLGDMPEHVPEWFKKIIGLCLADEPQKRPSAKDLLLEFPPPPPPLPPPTTFDQNEPPLSPVIYEAVPDSNPPSPNFSPPHFGSPMSRPSDTMGHPNGGNVGSATWNKDQATQVPLNGNVKGKDAVNGDANEVGAASSPGKPVIGIPSSNGSAKGYQNHIKAPTSGSIKAGSSRNGIEKESPWHSDLGFTDGENHNQNQIRSPIAKSSSQTFPKSKIPQRQVSDKFQMPVIEHGKT